MVEERELEKAAAPDAQTVVETSLLDDIVTATRLKPPMKAMRSPKKVSRRCWPSWWNLDARWTKSPMH
jgi:hypothetical protein